MRVVVMLPTIQFDHELCGVRDKIDDVGTDRRLTTKTNAVQSVSADSAPNYLLGFCGVFAQCARMFSRLGLYAPRWDFRSLFYNFVAHDFGEAAGPLPNPPPQAGEGIHHALKPPASVGKSSGRKP
jgi:hypothetical protein